MIKIQGKHNEAIVYTDTIENTAKQQITDLVNEPFLEDAKIRLMPDLHAGKGCTVGTTMTVHDKIVPNFVGVDLGCGMLCAKVSVQKKDINFKKLDQAVRKTAPSGMNIRNQSHSNAGLIPFNEVRAPFNQDRAKKSIGTLGGGNHFIEVNEGKDGSIYLVIHSGSRHFGKQISDHYQQVASELRSTRADKPRSDMAYVDGQDMDDYLHDVDIAQKYAATNRETMVEVICEAIGWDVLESFDTIHNYVDLDNRILRKGAISAGKGEIVLIPMNMRDGSLICRGKGNPDWNYSGPHGAGRVMSRTQARKQVKLQDFQETMKDVWSTSVVRHTIDESPFVYKKMEDIVKHIGPTVDVLEVIKPLYNYKANN